MHRCIMEKAKQGKNPGLRKIALAAGVSHSTVSRALRGNPLISAAQRDRILKIARDMGYRPDPGIARVMAEVRGAGSGARKHSLAVLLCGSPAGLRWLPVTQILHGIRQRCDQLGFALDELTLDADMSASRLLDILKARGLEGVLLVQSFGMKFPDYLNLFHASLPCVQVGRENDRLSSMHTIRSNLRNNIRLLAHQALDYGHQRIAVMHYPQQDAETYLRMTEVFDSILAQNRKQAEWRLLNMPPPDAPQARERFLEQIAKFEPDCLLGQSRNELNWLSEAGIDVPDQLSYLCLGCGIYPETARVSGVNQAEERIGKASVDHLVTLLQSPDYEATGDRILIDGFWQEGRTHRVGKMHYRPHETWQYPWERVKKASAIKLECLEIPRPNVSLSGSGGWFGDGPLLGIGAGKHLIHGVPFDILDDAKGTRPAALVMRSTESKRIVSLEGRPIAAEARIPVQATVKAVYILHACAYAGKLETFGRYLLRHASGKETRVDLCVYPSNAARTRLGGRLAKAYEQANIADWYPQGPSIHFTQGRVALLHGAEGSLEFTPQLYTLEIVNPLPADPIVDLQITTNPRSRVTLGILAVSVLV